MTILDKSHQGEEQGEGMIGGDGEQIEWKLSEVNT